jgi:hypothetical protein
MAPERWLHLVGLIVLLSVCSYLLFLMLVSFLVSG